jgi:lysyl-tRNA synthetase class I
MPVIHLEFDDTKVSFEEARVISEAIRTIVSEVTKIEDVMVYGRSAEIKVKVHPIEIFVQMSAQKIEDVGTLLGLFKDRLVIWKKETGFQHPVNLSLIPMPWKFEIGI